MLARNIVHFTRVLRRAGLPLGPAVAIDALRAVRAVGLGSRQDFYFALSAVMVQRHEQQFVFDEAFQRFWQDPSRVGQQLQELLRLLGGLRSVPARRPPPPQRVAQALFPNMGRAADSPAQPPQISIDSSDTASARETLQHKDFASMTPDELREARRMIASMRLPLPRLPGRRTRSDPRGPRVDLRGTMKSMMREPDGMAALRFRSLVRRPPTVIVLCDISRSMEPYTRMLLHFMHALTNDRDRVHTFLFGTQLSNISRALRDRDVDVALDKVARQVHDWAGGTRIGACLKEFNRRWARRLMAQGAVVLIISDGLEGEEADDLGKQMQALRLASRWMIWLNPLLRYERFEARPAGIRAMLPHVDRFLPVHHLNSLEALGRALSSLQANRRHAVPVAPTKMRG
ncbi:vWA domain-containing protein [Noviherbaspirillum galbum]|nr:VWA domain-containing protein [Noviherbaspirillum galbum]